MTGQHGIEGVRDQGRTGREIWIIESHSRWAGAVKGFCSHLLNGKTKIRL